MWLYKSYSLKLLKQYLLKLKEKMCKTPHLLNVRIPETQKAV